MEYISFDGWSLSTDGAGNCTVWDHYTGEQLVIFEVTEEHETVSSIFRMAAEALEAFGL